MEEKKLDTVLDKSEMDGTSKDEHGDVSLDNKADAAPKSKRRRRRKKAKKQAPGRESAKTEETKVYELDIDRPDILTLLEDEPETFASISNATAEQKDLDHQISYYKELMKSGRDVEMTFTSSSRNSLSAICNNIQLIYNLDIPDGLSDRQKMAEMLGKKYLLHVIKVDEENGNVYFASREEKGRRERVIKKINQKLDAGEPVYLRGQIIGLQGESGKRRDHEAAYVNINGVGVLGVIPCSKWTTGFKSLKDFRDTIISNRGTIVNFRVCAKTYDGDWVKYVCSREDYLKAIGQDPWQILKKCYQPKMNVRVRVVEKGPSNDGSYFCSLDGLRDINFLSYVDEKSGLEQKDVVIGKEYYGYIQKMNPDKKFARVRLTGAVGDK